MMYLGETETSLRLFQESGAYMMDTLLTFVIGLGIVFIGLVSLVAIVKAMGWIMGKKKPVQPVPMAPVQKEPTRQEVIPEANHGELVAAISAALATVMGKQVNGIRILSMKKVDE